MFIVLEGIDGCGKTTQSLKLADLLGERLGPGRVIRTFEPGDWHGGDKIREFLLEVDFADVWSEFFLFMADRCEHVARVIAPALADGCVVLSDRYNQSTIAYQLYGNGDVAPETRSALARLPQLVGLPEPDVIVLLDIGAGEAEARLAARGKGNSFDARGRAFFDRVRGGYDEMMRTDGRARWICVDASGGEDEVFAAIMRKLGPVLEAAGL